MKPPKIITDEASGIGIPNLDYEMWVAGYGACSDDLRDLIDQVWRVSTVLMNEITRQGVEKMK